MDLADLLSRFVADGDVDAIHTFVDRTRPRLLAAARRIHGADAEDAVQTAYLALLRRSEVPRPSPLAWLVTATVRISYRHVARRRREVEIGRRLAREAADRTSDGVDAEFVRAAVDRLAPKYRDVVILHYLDGLTVAECGRLLRLRPEAVRQRLKRARDLLRSRLPSRVATLVLGVPWLLRDAAAAMLIGGVMKFKLVAGAVLLLVVLSAGFVVWNEERPSATAPRMGRTQAPTNAQARSEPEPATKPVHAPSVGETPTPFAFGVVVDEAGQPLAGVRLVVQPRLPGAPEPRGHWLETALAETQALHETDEDGRFETDMLDLGPNYGLAFFKPGFAARSVALKRDARQNREMRVVLQRAAPCAGRVLDTSDRPIPLARVAIGPGRAGEVGQIVFTDSSGAFSFATAPDTAPIVYVSAPGYASVPIAAAAALDVTLTRNATIIDVTDAKTGQPLSQAAITLVRGRDLTHVAAARAEGSHPKFPAPLGRAIFPLASLTALRTRDELSIVAQVFAPSHRTRSQGALIRTDLEPPHLAVALDPGQPEMTVSGRVVGADDATIDVLAGLPEGLTRGHEVMPLLQSTKASGGTFSLALPPGRYQLIGRASGQTDVRVLVEAPAADVVLSFLPGCALDVLTAPGTWVHVEVDDGEKRFWNAQADDEGVARFVGLPEARARAVLGQHSLWYGAGMVWRLFEPRGATALHPGTGASLKLDVPQRRAVVLRLRDDRGRAISGRVATLTAATGFALLTPGESLRLQALKLRSDASGSIAVDVFPGHYSVVLGRGGSRRAKVLSVDQETREVVIVIPAIGTRLQGVVRDAESDVPVAGRRVSVSSKDGTLYLGPVITDADGRFLIEQIPAGSFEITVSGGNLPQIGGFAGNAEESPYGGARRTVELDGAGPRTVRFALPPIKGPDAVNMPVRFAVRVMDAATGQAVPGASVVLRARIGDTWHDVAIRRSLDGIVTGHVYAADAYDATAHASGYESKTVPITATGSKTGARIEVAARIRREG